MGNEKYSFLKQWFTFKHSTNNQTELLYSCTNNHYIHSWLEKHGYIDFTNTINETDLDLFIHDLNESYCPYDKYYTIHDRFSEFFPDNYIKYYSLWNMDKCDYWPCLYSYQEHAKKQIGDLFDKLWDVQNNLESGYSGVLQYHIFYNH